MDFSDENTTIVRCHNIGPFRLETATTTDVRSEKSCGFVDHQQRLLSPLRYHPYWRPVNMRKSRYQNRCPLKQPVISTDTEYATKEFSVNSALQSDAAENNVRKLHHSFDVENHIVVDGDNNAEIIVIKMDTLSVDSLNIDTGYEADDDITDDEVTMLNEDTLSVDSQNSDTDEEAESDEFTMFPLCSRKLNEEKTVNIVQKIEDFLKLMRVNSQLNM